VVSGDRPGPEVQAVAATTPRSTTRESTMGNIGWPEILLVLLVVLLLFGATRLPQLGRSMGQGIRGFKQGLKEDPPADDEVEPADDKAAEAEPAASEKKPEKEDDPPAS
jgi:sec-independent protein translocase protein TatA